jgi:phage/plasmid-like protein (TIGR03299 family)
MSLESAEWLNNQTLIGFTDLRGYAWHYAIALQGDEPNHYPGEIPVEDVRRRLFDWKAESRELYIPTQAGFTAVPDRQAIVRSDTEDVLGVFKSGYAPHQYDEWLVRNVETILDDTLKIGSAGVLRNGAQAWVSVELAENRNVQGVEFRPQLIAATSFDGSLATTYKRSAQIVVCDNTLAAGLAGDGERYRLKHTRYSGGKIRAAREALKIVFDTADAVGAEITRLLEVDVPRKAFADIVDILIPITDSHGKALTMAENKRGEVNRLYRHDDRVAPWAGTGWGVLMAFNTFQHHGQSVRGASRVQRNKANALGSTIAESDNAVIAAMERVLARS